MFHLFRTTSAISSILPKLSIEPIKITAKQEPAKQLLLRTMSLAELAEVRATWIREEGWPGVRHGLGPTYSLDPQGFYLLEKDQEKVASVSVVSYPAIKAAYLGFYVVPKSLRGNGYGDFAFNQAIAHTMLTREITTFGLNCFTTMSPLYKKWGFTTYTVDSIWKFTASTNNIYSDANAVDTIKSTDSISQDFFKQLVQYDAEVFGADRADFLGNYINKPDTITVVYIDNNKIQGYGIISSREPVQEEPHASYRVGPLYAQDGTIAENLLQHLIAATKLNPNESVYLETPGTNPHAAPIITKFGFVEIYKMDKMYKGEPPKHDEKRIFCYNSLATGP